MTAPLLRLAAAADFVPIAAITNHYIRTSAIHFGYAEVSPAELQAQWRDHGGLYPWLVAVNDGEVVAYAKAGPWRARSAYRWTPETAIYVAPAHRGRGIGRNLYARLCAVLRAQGFRSAIAGATMPNDASVRLHLSLGFVACGRVVDAGYKHDRWHDVQFFQLRLSEGDAPGGELRSPELAFAATAAPAGDSGSC